VCGLFNSVVSNSESIALHEGMIVNNKLESIWEEQPG
jgi:hypothetical protein